MSNSPQLSLFSHPFSLAYWRAAAGELKKPKILVLAALFIGLDIAIGAFFIPVPGAQNLRIYFTFLVKGLGGMIYGPVVGILSGFVGDLIGYMLFPSGPFFFGYTLTAMLSGLTYALFFYRVRVGLLRIIFCKLSVNLFINVCLGSVWSAMLYAKGYLYYLSSSIVKNLLLLPAEILLFVLFFGCMMPILIRAKLVPPGISGFRQKERIEPQAEPPATV